MDFKTLVNFRYSVRKFTEQDIETEKMELIFESARKAPSAVNFQPYKIFAVKSPDKLEALKACYHRDWIKNAPIVLVIVGVHSMAWKRGFDNKDFTDIDTAIFIDHITLQATELGLGTCWVCNFDITAVSELLQLKHDEEPIALLPIGYPENEEAPAKKRKGIDELVKWI